MPRTRPACVPLPQRVHALHAGARRAAVTDDLAEAATVHNQAALLASDCGLSELARHWCRCHARIYLAGHPLPLRQARLALEPVTNLARLAVREGHGQRAFDLIDTLFGAVSARQAADIDGIAIPADLTDSTETHQQLRAWLWAVLLATGGRALASAGRWQQAYQQLNRYHGIGTRMFDGRQIAIIAHAVADDTTTTQHLLTTTTPGDPWETAVTAALTIHCHPAASGAARDSQLDGHLAHYYRLEPRTELTVFHTRLALTLLDGLTTTTTTTAGALADQLAADIIATASANPDGYTAREVLAHPTCRAQLGDRRTRALTDLVHACGLGSGQLPSPLRDDLNNAIATAEQVMTQLTGTERTAASAPRNPVASDHRSPTAG